MRINEIFPSVQGEGTTIGVPSIFIRTAGCNLKCTWCDTPYTSWKPEGKSMDIDEIMRDVEAHSPIKNIVLTGGEPLIQPEIVPLVERLAGEGYNIQIETNGTIYRENLNGLAYFTVSPKLSRSVPTGEFSKYHEEHRMNLDILRQYKGKGEFKFVVASRDDLDEVKDLTHILNLSEETVVLMPEGISEAVVMNGARWLAEVVKKELPYARVIPRLQILMYGNKRGT